MGKSILIVDDNSDVLEVIEDILKTSGHFKFVVKSQDGAEAAKKITRQEFDIVLSDINMPRKNGIELAKILAGDANNLASKLILFSGNFSQEMITEAMSLGVKHFLTKPITAKALMAKVELAIAEKQNPTPKRTPAASPKPKKVAAGAPYMEVAKGILAIIAGKKTPQTCAAELKMQEQDVTKLKEIFIKSGIAGIAQKLKSETPS